MSIWGAFAAAFILALGLKVLLIPDSIGAFWTGVFILGLGIRFMYWLVSGE